MDGSRLVNESLYNDLRAATPAAAAMRYLLHSHGDDVDTCVVRVIALAFPDPDDDTVPGSIWTTGTPVPGSECDVTILLAVESDT